MLSVGPDARRISPSQDIQLTEDTGHPSVMYITDKPPSLAHNLNCGLLPPPSIGGIGDSALHQFFQNAEFGLGGGSVVAKSKRNRSFNVKVFLDTVDGGRTIANYRKNQKIFSQGDPADSVFYIQDGRVKVCVISEQGKEAVVALHGNGDFFGEGCLTGQPLRLATVAAMTDCVIMRLDKAAIVRVLHDEPKFSEMFMSYLLARNARVEEDLVDQLFNSSEKRLV